MLMFMNRLASSAVVDGRVRQGNHDLLVANAVWDAVHGSGNAQCGQGKSMHNLRMCSCHIDTELLQNKFPDTPPEACAACVARLVYYRYINPAIMYAHLRFLAMTRLTSSSAHQRRSILCQQQSTLLHARTWRRYRRCWPRSQAAPSLATRALRIYPSTTMFGRASLRLLLGFCKVCPQDHNFVCVY